MNDLPGIVERCKVSIYADDAVHYSFSSSVAVLKYTLNADLAMVADWLNMNKLTHNLQNSQSTIIGRTNPKKKQKQKKHPKKPPT